MSCSAERAESAARSTGCDNSQRCREESRGAGERRAGKNQGRRRGGMDHGQFVKVVRLTTPPGSPGSLESPESGPIKGEFTPYSEGVSPFSPGLMRLAATLGRLKSNNLYP